MKAVAHRTARYQQVLSGAIQYLLRDDFTDTRAAGAVNGTPATPGPGVRTVTDGNSKLSIGSGLASIATGGVVGGDPGIWYSLQSRISGLLLLATANAPTAGNLYLGWNSNTSSTPLDSCVRFTASSTLRVHNNSVLISVGTYTSGGSYTVFNFLRAVGAYYFVRGGTEFSFPTLVWIGPTGSSDLHYPNLAGDATCVASIGRVRLVATDWLPSPLASDGFGGSFGTTDGLGHAEGVAGGIGSGGGGLSWTQQVGTWGTSGGKAVATSLTGGVAIATVPLPSANVINSVAITRTANSVGPVVRYVDTNNYVYAVHDGTNSKLVKRVAGTETVLVNVAATYSANASPIIDCNGTAFRLYYNNTLSGTSTISDSVLQSSTLAGILTKDTGNTLDDFVVYAKGAEGQYSTLNQYTS